MLADEAADPTELDLADLYAGVELAVARLAAIVLTAAGLLDHQFRALRDGKHFAGDAGPFQHAAGRPSIVSSSR